MLDPTSAGLTDLAAAVRRREITSEALVDAYLARIDALQPSINAVTALAQEARTRARECDVDLARGISRGVLHGIPFTVKDVFAAIGTVSVLDTRMRQRSAPTRNATVITRLRGAGAILLGKTNSPPNGHGRDAETAYTGRTLNPYDLKATPGGSSGAEAALIAAGGSPLGLGSDQQGGVRVPAHFCGVASLKPTMGRIPSTGAYNHPGGVSDLRTQIGPIARRVDDLNLVMPLLCGPDHLDSGVVEMPWRDPKDVAVRTLRVAFLIEDPNAPVSPPVGRAMGDAVQALARAGVTLEEVSLSPLIAAGVTVDHYLRNMAGIPGREVVETFSEWDEVRTSMLQFMLDYDALLCPAGPTPAPPFRDQDPARFIYTLPFSLTGHPAAVVPVGRDPAGRPVGAQIVARPWREDVALALAKTLEDALGGWQPPAGFSG
ncbi:MAG: amidase [Caldilineaceae bacterium]|nr:amidase [Caldilineaceae bacterium]